MCGIVGYLGDGNAKDIVLDGLKALEYRGYDSAGIAIGGDSVNVYKCVGNVDKLSQIVPSSISHVAIGHTRWATHGKPTALNAHPHLSFDGRIAVVHNGVIENSEELKRELVDAGITFASDTDSEIIAHMLALDGAESMRERIERVGSRLQGSASFLAIAAGDERIYAHKQGASLAVGESEDGRFAASDTLAIAKYATQVYILHDGEDAVLSREGINFYKNGQREEKRPSKVIRTMPVRSSCMMRVEIEEIPAALKRCFKSVNSSLDALIADEIKRSKRIYLVGSGTAYHAALYGKSIISPLIPCEAIPASEFDSSALTGEGGYAIFITQSGETADTLQAVSEAKSLHIPTLAVTNVPASSITFLADRTIDIDAGAEVAVAATKSYNCQLLALYMLYKRLRGETMDICSLNALADKCALMTSLDIFEESFARSKLFMIGKGIDFITAKEGVLKFKEVTYRMTDAYASGELKHGPIALIDKDCAVIAIATTERHRIAATISELRSRNARVIVLSALGDIGADKTLALPSLDDPLLYPILSSIPLQKIALEAAEALGLDPDKPRNLAKSVTVI